MIGKVLFWLLWPLVWLYAPLTRRVRVVIIRRSGETLLIKNWFGPGMWQLPGGGINFGETVAAAAKREVLEELHIHLNQVKVLNEEPVVCRQFGLLMRYHYVLGEVKQEESLQLGRDVVTYTWADISSKSGLSTEVNQGVKLADTL